MPGDNLSGTASLCHQADLAFPLPVRWLRPRTAQEETPRGPLFRTHVPHRGHPEEDASHWPEHVFPNRPRADQPGQDTLRLGEGSGVEAAKETREEAMAKSPDLQLLTRLIVID